MRRCACYCVGKRTSEKSLDFEIIIETAAGLENINEIALASDRLVAMSFGVADYAASMGCRQQILGERKRGITQTPKRVKSFQWIPGTTLWLQ